MSPKLGASLAAKVLLFNYDKLVKWRYNFVEEDNKKQLF